MKHLVTPCLVLAILIFATATASAQTFGWPQQFENGFGAGQCASGNCGAGQSAALDLMDPRNFKLRDYRQMFLSGSTPTPQDLIGTWRGVNKGIVTLLGFKQFVKEIQPTACGLYGENIRVEQVANECLRQIGWQPKPDKSGNLQYHDRFQIQPQDCKGKFGHGIIFSYRDGGNRKLAPSRVLVDRVVKIDPNHLVGRVIVRTLGGPIPVAYFVLERVN